MRVAATLAEVVLDAARWDDGAPTVFQTWAWQSCWWQVFGRGTLAVALDPAHGFALPLFCDDGVLYPVGAGNSDYLDVIAPPGIPEDLRVRLLAEGVAAAMETTGARSLRWHLLRRDSPTFDALPRAAALLGLRVHVEDDSALPAPAIRLGRGAVERTSLRRRTRWLERNGTLEVDRPSGPELVAALPCFFHQHVRRWTGTGVASPFEDAPERDFYLALAAQDPPWLRMTRLWWDGVVIAQHVGASFRGCYLWYKPTFAVALRDRSPGTALLHQLLRDAMAEGCSTFDLGIGAEPFKDRYADHAVDTLTVRVAP